MTELQALLFDVDGTLAETEEVHREAFNAAFAAAGLDWHWDQATYGDLLGVTGGRERIRFFLEKYRPAFSPPADLDAWIADLHKAKTRIYTERVAGGGVPLRPGVRRLLEEARAAGLRLAIATTTTPDNVIALLKASLAPDAEDWFELIAAGGIVPSKKPAPDIYHYTLEAMQLSPQACLALEDSHNGLISALAADIPTLITVSHYTRGQDFSGAALVVDQLGEPGQPFRLLAGEAGEADCVDVALLRRLHRACRSAAPGRAEAP
ncbi:phosphatase [Thiohalobacter sp. COW1]|uniref:Phosphatase/phosphohexomutase n=1 Tax=Thiohalobacter thiocyanaticus TaxID=585455 RepID=A0A1Z4VS33_9GAMM|nr:MULTISPECIES: HAD-IA family hydrolase [Thiohalobacter]BAZ94148.1 phosphatase/phosphohexomutase [Thiohalobacter thiocyanaticus]BCO30797.1 phosphatase [Thiohalobacter sp. COW1]